MVIKNVGSEKAGAPERPVPPAAPVAPRQPLVRVAREDGDRVEISAEARALAELAEGPDGPLSAEQVAELREWIRSGAFDRPEVLDAVARRILDRGDL